MSEYEIQQSFCNPRIMIVWFYKGLIKREKTEISYQRGKNTGRQNVNSPY